MAITIQRQIDNLETMQKRIELLVGARLKIDSVVQKAVLIQDSIRSKIRGWNGPEEIRKWREKKAS